MTLYEKQRIGGSQKGEAVACGFVDVVSAVACS